jgi:hypothetical protein
VKCKNLQGQGLNNQQKKNNNNVTIVHEKWMDNLNRFERLIHFYKD